jgi:hypothetical protein
MRWPGHRLALAFFTAVLAAWLAVMAVLVRASALPPEASGPMLVVFAPGEPDTVVFDRIVKAGARPVRATAFGFIWVVAGDTPGTAGRLVAAGALGAYQELPISASIAGCFALADATVVSALSP